MQITTQEIEGVTYYTTIARGVQYTIYKNGSEWAVSSRRLALSRMNPGTYRTFKTLVEFENQVKAMRGIAALLDPAVEMAQA